MQVTIVTIVTVSGTCRELTFANLRRLHRLGIEFRVRLHAREHRHHKHKIVSLRSEGVNNVAPVCVRQPPCWVKSEVARVPHQAIRYFGLVSRKIPQTWNRRDGVANPVIFASYVRESKGKKTNAFATSAFIISAISASNALAISTNAFVISAFICKI